MSLATFTLWRTCGAFHREPSRAIKKIVAMALSLGGWY
jgi:hypothetical protein